MHNNIFVKKALRKAFIYYFLGSALISIVLYFAIPPIWLWCFVIIVIFVVHPSNDVFTAMGRKE